MNMVGIAKSEVVETQSDVYQPLKFSDIHYLATAGAIKQGAGNINGTEWYDTKGFSKIDLVEDPVELHAKNSAFGKKYPHILEKDQGKANYANAYIGFGKPGSSTAQYQQDFGDSISTLDGRIDASKINGSTVAFVSVNGDSINGTPEIELTK